MLEILSNTHSKWNQLQLQDLKSIHDYNSTLYIITLQLRLRVKKNTNEDMLKSTFSIFHTSNMVL